MVTIAPSILSANLARLWDDVAPLQDEGADWVHIDVMDGQFVPNLTFGPPVIKALRDASSLPFDVHLMVETPERLLHDYVEAGADWLTVHWETCPHLHRTLQQIRSLGVKAGVALNPATPASSLESVLDCCDLVLVMSVNPGFGGQSFLASQIKKIQKLRNMVDEQATQTLISVDGGVQKGNAASLVAAGVDVLVAGSAIYKQADRRAAIQALRQPT